MKKLPTFSKPKLRITMASLCLTNSECLKPDLYFFWFVTWACGDPATHSSSLLPPPWFLSYPSSLSGLCLLLPPFVHPDWLFSLSMCPIALSFWGKTPRGSISQAILWKLVQAKWNNKGNQYYWQNWSFHSPARVLSSSHWLLLAMKVLLKHPENAESLL